MYGMRLFPTTHQYALRNQEEIRNIRQVELTIRQLRVTGVTFLLIPLAVAYTSLGMSAPTAVPIMIAIGLIFVETIIFAILIYKAK